MLLASRPGGSRSRETQRVSRHAVFVGERILLRGPPAHLLTMPGQRGAGDSAGRWEPTPDSAERFSCGIPRLDELLGGGFRRGSLALFHVDETVETADWELLFTPTLLNFLYQSRGILAVLPSRESPHGFRAQLIRWVTRKRFDTRVRIVDYVGEDDEAPYVVGLRPVPGSKKSEAAKRRKALADMAKMVTAEKAVRGARSRPFIELIAFEIMEMTVGAETAARMFLHGIKRTRQVGNLCLGILRPGLGCSDAVRGMADVEFALHHDRDGLVLRGLRPLFPPLVVLADPRIGAPHLVLKPLG